MKKLYRSRRDKKVTGLCGGLAEAFNIDATLLRVVVVVTAIFSTGFPVFVIYIIASLVIPKEPVFEPPYTGGIYGGVPPYTGGYQSYPGANPGTQPGAGSSYNRQPGYTPPQSQARPVRDELDEMMKDIEKKALRKEIEELRAKLDKYENNKGDV
jgi:phage shock protein PspC (stress-responsive transcriptional regulator)